MSNLALVSNDLPDPQPLGELIGEYEFEGGEISLYRPTGHDLYYSFQLGDRGEGQIAALLSRTVLLNKKPLSPENISEWDAEDALFLTEEFGEPLTELENPENDGFPKEFKYANPEQIERFKQKIFEYYPTFNPEQIKQFLTQSDKGTKADREFAIAQWKAIESPILTQRKQQTLGTNERAQRKTEGKVGTMSWGLGYAINLACELLLFEGKQLGYDNWLDLDANLLQVFLLKFAPQEKKRKFKKKLRPSMKDSKSRQKS